jgi:hypothetical protein
MVIAPWGGVKGDRDRTLSDAAASLLLMFLIVNCGGAGPHLVTLCFSLSTLFT